MNSKINIILIAGVVSRGLKRLHLDGMVGKIKCDFSEIKTLFSKMFFIPISSIVGYIFWNQKYLKYTAVLLTLQLTVLGLF